MELNLKLIGKLANLLQVDASVLQKAMTDINIDTGLPEKIFSQNEVDILVDNVQKEKYETGKTAGIEMTLKDLKKQYSEDYGLELDGVKNYKELISKLNDFKTEKLRAEIETIKKKSGVESNSQIEALESKIKKGITENEDLRKVIKDINLKFEDEKVQLKNNFNAERGNNRLNRQFAGLSFRVPKTIENLGDEEIVKYLKTQNNNAIDLFKTKYTVDYNDEGKEVIINKLTNEVLKDELQNVEKLENLIIPFAKNQYLNIADEKTAGRDSKNNGMKVSFVGMTRNDFFQYIDKKGIKKFTKEFDAAYDEFSKAK